MGFKSHSFLLSLGALPLAGLSGCNPNNEDDPTPDDGGGTMDGDSVTTLGLDPKGDTGTGSEGDEGNGVGDASEGDETGATPGGEVIDPILYANCIAAYTTQLSCAYESYGSYDASEIAMYAAYACSGLGYAESYGTDCVATLSEVFACLSLLSCETLSNTDEDSRCVVEFGQAEAACPFLAEDSP